MSRCLLVLSLTAAFLLAPSRWLRAEDAPPKELLVDQVRKAIDRGIQYLRDAEKGDGNWEAAEKGSVIAPGGWTCLATLALLNAGVSPDDPIIRRSLSYVRSIQPNQTYVVALQTMVFAETHRNEDRIRIQSNVNWLIDAMVKQNGLCAGWSYGKERRTFPDNSNTQYALLGLHAGHLAGAQINRQVWKSIQDYYIREQKVDHGWIYSRAMERGTTLTMTTAGLCGLLISGMELNAGREVLKPDGTAAHCGEYQENLPATQALGWIGDHFRIDLPGYTYYSLYGIERAGRLSGQRFFGGHDWYREGCEYLVREQREDGSWYADRGNSHDSWPVISTSFALLFLSKGRTPVLISKLVHGPGEDWNNDRNDARNLVDYAGTDLFRHQTMAWQIFDTGRVRGEGDFLNDDDIKNLVGDLLQSPIVYLNGHERPVIGGADKKLLKQYVEQGGFILAEACCGRKEFDAGFRDLMQELFPENPLRKLPPEHPIWQAHAAIPPDAVELWGIEYGCKTVVVYSPHDLSCLWEANDRKSPRGQLAFRLGGNIIAYATGLEPPKPRLSPTEVIPEPKEGTPIPRGYLKVAQLRHDGDWQPAPNAMRYLLDHLHKQDQLDVDLRTKPIFAADPDLPDFRFLYLHGRGNFTLSEAGIKNLRMNLETGGLLFADACCGKKPFDSAFRALMLKLFPDQKLEPIPLSDDLYSQDLNGAAITTVRCRTEPAGVSGQGGQFRQMPPYLEGIRLGNRWAVIYSKYDIGCALEKHPSTDCLGHDHPSALKLGGAAVLYALKR